MEISSRRLVLLPPCCCGSLEKFLDSLPLVCVSCPRQRNQVSEDYHRPPSGGNTIAADRYHEKLRVHMLSISKCSSMHHWALCSVCLLVCMYRGGCPGPSSSCFVGGCSYIYICDLDFGICAANLDLNHPWLLKKVQKNRPESWADSQLQLFVRFTLYVTFSFSFYFFAALLDLCLQGSPPSSL